MDILSFINLLVIGLFLVLLGIVGIKVLFKIGKTVIGIVFNMLMGFAVLFLANLLPFINIPLNILTIAVAGFGGIMGVGLLIFAQVLGFF
ncbi:pro-sigmaK processing inhibitor BofA family protein [Methanobacterium alkalithermotolerans]|uniref:Pro-sigmaK processing inhibitor BofA family protein n=1 Tax=Methanobacterium alkalithermotolerans TaxID=2731220 RepID=A0A8T8K5G4_9EURY|nr:pro-sigmaK processing inhibitor BofA family protein [Methanobacterium alkalithermotolerans]QUH23247.1 pro-sigmaK processing inhibitor BofA family protein [Methanobacterium alkalithermotolerans]